MSKVKTSHKKVPVNFNPVRLWSITSPLCSRIVSNLPISTRSIMSANHVWQPSTSVYRSSSGLSPCQTTIQPCSGRGLSLLLVHLLDTSSTAQGGGESFNIGNLEENVVVVSHGWQNEATDGLTERWLALCLLQALHWLQ